MKNLFVNLTLLLTLMITLGACSKSESGDSAEDVVLTTGETISCSDATSFSIIPSEGDEPDITISKNTSTGVTTVTYDSTTGSATVVGCSKI